MTLARGMDRIASERLLLRRIAPDDFEFFCDLHADPDVARYIGHGRPRTPDESIVWLKSLLGTYEDFALGQLAVLRKSDGMLIGRCGLSDFAVEARPGTAAVRRAWFSRTEVPHDTEIVMEYELGYTFHRSSWGQGYARKAAGLVFDYSRNVLRLPRVISVIHPENVRSLRLARRFGVQREDAVEVMSRILDRFVWPISQNPVWPRH